MILQYIEKRIPFGKAPQGPPPPGEMWVMEEEGKVVAVNFLCPCGCGCECYTPIRAEGEPPRERHWGYAPGPTLSPSIRFTGGCKAHFNITDGKTILHADSGH
jgi:hypothetical protein